MALPKKPDNNVRPHRPWIFSAVYWNDVAKDVVKATSAALVIYLFGAIAGVFKLHIAILWIVLVVLAGILLYTTLEYLFRKGKVRRAWLAGGIIGAVGGGVLGQIINSNWHLPGWTGYPVGAGFALVTAGVGVWLGGRVLPRTVRSNGPTDKDES